MTSEQLTALFLGLAAVLALSQVLARLARALGQPAVVGEILAGVLIGPTVADGAIARALFPDPVRPPLSALAGVGLAVFMFVVGAQLHGDAARAGGSGGRGTVLTPLSIAVGATVLPFVLGSLLAWWLAAEHAPGRPYAFVLFVGAAMSVTAVPVLARILEDRELLRTEVGGLALASAGLVDLFAWALLAVAVVVGGGRDGDPWQVLLVPLLVLVVLGLVRPGYRRLARAVAAGGAGERTAAVVVLVGLLLTCAAAEALGVHFVFGAFLFGVAVDARSRWLRRLTDQVTPLTTMLLLPVFFVLGGLQVDLSGIDARRWVELAAILAVATSGKFAGAYLAARLRRMPRRTAATLGVLMNTRGLTELVILSVGLQLGLLDTALYSLLVVMAIVTTLMTGPLLRLLDAVGRPGPAQTVPVPGPSSGGLRARVLAAMTALLRT